MSFVLGPACRTGGEAHEADEGRLTARPRANVKTAAKGESALGLGRSRDAMWWTARE